MLYPLSYEGGTAFPQVRPYIPGRLTLVPSDFVPSACPIDE
jgi:hypothetical protein